jgi:ubiquinone/menaquinone biosynthesis C-methylase UbiE
MEQPGSYVAEEMPGGLDREVARLREQALLSWDRELRVLLRLGLADGTSILDVGGGPGFVTEQLLASLPESRVTMIDRDPAMIDQARRYLQPVAGARLDLVEASVMETGLPDAAFDFAIARLVFQHLPDPVGAAREVWRVLKPGGRIVVIDVDDTLQIYDPPNTPELEAIFQRLGAQQEAKGGSRFIGRRLPRILKQAGFSDLELESVLLHSDIMGLERLADDVDPALWQAMVDSGRITEAERTLILASIERFSQSDPIIQITVLMAGGRKPTG